MKRTTRKTQKLKPSTAAPQEMPPSLMLGLALMSMTGVLRSLVQRVAKLEQQVNKKRKKG